MIFYSRLYSLYRNLLLNVLLFICNINLYSLLYFFNEYNNTGTQKKSGLFWEPDLCILMYFDALNPNLRLVLPRHPQNFFKIAKNREKSRKIVKIHTWKYRLWAIIFLWVYYTWFLCILTRWNRIWGLFCPSKYEKLVKNCENTKNITENHETSH